MLAHQAALPTDEVVERIPVTSVHRTLLDLAATLTLAQLEAALNRAEAQGLRDRLSLPDLMERHPRRRGSAALRALLEGEAASQGVPKSVLEERFAALIADRGLPRPRLNAGIAVHGRFLTVDCAWDAARLAVELDGRADHRTARAFEEDRERDRLLLVAGWRVIRVTWRQLEQDADAIVRDLTAALVVPRSTL